MVEIMKDKKLISEYDVITKYYPDKYCWIRYHEANENSNLTNNSLVEVISVYDSPAELALTGGELWNKIRTMDGISGEIMGVNLRKPLIGGLVM